ncbi:dihydrodipicolinate synthase family protein [Paraglaciecola arctica]|uniref:dihydrodipicolinate synthase family protein n=1 Tax=Paraglaciecola arctica TaxID=1128911 RepID=UPI001C06FB52|nr:dihydrodipicolinate synthase family protein [Paraglaciecola arctica]MBU3005272.1 dihydrodipicolinate synthase family protein [Paraglaciecola arctica]
MSVNNHLSGTFPVIPTPFSAEGDIDLKSFKSAINYILECGVDGVVFPGLASEYSYLTREERLETTKLVGELTQGKVPFVVGASASTPEQVIEYSVHGAQAGAVCAMVMAPNKFAGDEQAMVNFYKELAQKANIPVMLQNAPAPMGAGMAIETVISILKQVPEIRYVKEETMPCGQRMEQLLAAAPDTLIGVFGGAGGRYIIDELDRNALGTVPACELTEVHKLLVDAHNQGQFEKALDLYCQMMPILNMQAIYRCSLTKQILFERGIITCPQVRDTGPKLDAKNIEELKKLYAKLDGLMPALKA